MRVYGWPGRSLVGTDGAQAAFLLVQHADHDLLLQKTALPLVESAYARAEVPGEAVALLTDRVTRRLSSACIARSSEYERNLGETALR